MQKKVDEKSTEKFLKFLVHRSNSKSGKTVWSKASENNLLTKKGRNLTKNMFAHSKLNRLKRNDFTNDYGYGIKGVGPSNIGIDSFGYYRSVHDKLIPTAVSSVLLS